MLKKHLYLSSQEQTNKQKNKTKTNKQKNKKEKCLSSLHLLFEASKSVAKKENNKKNMSFGLWEKVETQWLNNEIDGFR